MVHYRGSHPLTIIMMRYLPLVFTLLVAALLGACNDPVSLKDRGMVYCSEGEPETFNPQLASSQVTLDASSHQLYNRLLDVDPQTFQVRGMLARSWRISDDFTRYRLFLRKGVSFHTTPYFYPSRTMNADDVVFSFERILNADHPYHKVSGGRYPFFDGLQFTQLVRAVRKIDEYTVEFELSQPNVSFLQMLASDYAVILSAEYASQLLQQGHPERLDSQPIGTGPFILKSYRPTSHIRYIHHWGYWRGSAPMEQLVFDITSSSNNRLVKLLTKECDVIAYPVGSHIDMLKQRPEIAINVIRGFNVAFLTFNTAKPPLDDVRVRRAISYAINRKAILEAVYFGTADLADSVLPPVSWAHDDGPSSYRYDPVLARNMLEEAGIATGLSLELMLNPTTHVYNPDAVKMAELIQSDLAKVGIKMRFSIWNPASMRRKLRAGGHDMALLGWEADTTDPDNLFRQHLSCQAIVSGENFSNWCDPHFQQLIDNAITTPDLSQRIPLYLDAQQLVAKQLPILPLAHAQRLQAYQQSVGGLVMRAFGGVSFENAYRK